MNKLRFLVGIYGELVGLAVIALVCLWDFIYLGVRGFLQYSVSPLGIIVILLGVVLIVWSKHIDKNF